MLTTRLRDRCPSSEAVGVGTVRGRVLRWHKVSGDGSGKCDLAVGEESDIAHGVVFRIDSSERVLLDEAEGLGKGYELAELDIGTETGPVRCVAYLATEIDDKRQPYRWYWQLVLAGALEHRLPAACLTAIEDTPSITDPRPDRKSRREAERLIADFLQQHPEHKKRLTGVRDDQALA